MIGETDIANVLDAVYSGDTTLHPNLYYVDMENLYINNEWEEKNSKDPYDTALLFTDR